MHQEAHRRVKFISLIQHIARTSPGRSLEGSLVGHHTVAVLGYGFSMALSGCQTTQGALDEAKGVGQYAPTSHQPRPL